MSLIHSTPKPFSNLQPVLIAWMLISGGIFTTLILTWMLSKIKDNHPYRATLAAVQSHPEAIAALGEPIVPAFIVTGRYASGEGAAHADLSIPVKGPKGKGRAYVQGVLERDADEWIYFDWRLVLPDREEPISLGPTIPYVQWVEGQIAKEKAAMP